MACQNTFVSRCKTAQLPLTTQVLSGLSEIAVSVIKIPRTRENGTRMRHRSAANTPLSRRVVYQGWGATPIACRVDEY